MTKSCTSDSPWNCLRKASPPGIIIVNLTVKLFINLNVGEAFMHFAIKLLVVALLLNGVEALGQSCPCNDLKETPQSHLAPGVSLYNFAKVSDGIYRGSLPVNELDHDYLHKLGIKTILSIESMPWHTLTEPGKDQRHGFKYEHVTMAATPLQPWDSTIQTSVKILNDKSLYPIYLHCWAGVDRTGIIVSFYRLSQNCHAYDAFEELRTYHVSESEELTRIGFPLYWPLHGLIDYFIEHADFKGNLPRCDYTSNSATNGPSEQAPQ